MKDINAPEMVGNNDYWSYVALGGEYSKGFEDIMQAHKHCANLFNLALDMFAYGVICGKRIERNKKTTKA